MAKYQVDGAASRITVRATSSVHDIETVWNRMSGHIEVDPAQVASGATADIVVNMQEFDAGDWLKNRKLKKDLDVDRYPSARFTLSELRDVEGQESVTATAIGTIDWRGHVASITATGSATITDHQIAANATFDLNVTQLGVTPPRILMIKVADVVRVEVALRAKVSK